MIDRYFKCPNCKDENQKTIIVLLPEKQGEILHPFRCNCCERLFHEEYVRFHSDRELNVIVEEVGDLPSPTPKSALRKTG